MIGLAGKVAVVTGAARMRGIGRAIALRLAEEGCDVVVSGVPRDPSTFPEHEQSNAWRGVESVAEEIRALGRRALAIQCDVTQPDQVSEMVAAALAELGRVDVLVNNAALPSNAGSAPILDMDDDEWRRTVDVNLNGLYLVTKRVGHAIRDGGHGGSIVNVSSTAGRQGLPDYGAYCATKWAMIGMTQQLALELAPSAIRVNCICPGPTSTDMIDGTFRRTALHHGVPEDAARKGALRRIPLGRQGAVEDQAAAVAYLASDDASFITGQTLNVDGGMRMD